MADFDAMVAGGGPNRLAAALRLAGPGSEAALATTNGRAPA
jgi:phytoene dehydrogenase-like protein